MKGSKVDSDWFIVSMSDTRKLKNNKGIEYYRNISHYPTKKLIK